MWIPGTAAAYPGHLALTCNHIKSTYMTCVSCCSLETTFQDSQWLLQISGECQLWHCINAGDVCATSRCIQVEQRAARSCMRAVYAVDAELCNVLYNACHKPVRGAHGRDSSGLRVCCCSLQPQCAAHGADAELRICSNSSALPDARVAYTCVVCCAVDRLRWFIQVRYCDTALSSLHRSLPMYRSS